ncbi:MAG: dienelactone hydrolase, partial [Sulfitobacter sp.]
HLLTFENANHNAAAPIPAPAECWHMNGKWKFAGFDHYADAVWDTTRMNNIAQHFATAFLDLHLKGDGSKAPFLDLPDIPRRGAMTLADHTDPASDHIYWKGFAPRTEAGLKFESKSKGD